MTLGEKIAELRKQKGYSQEDLALKLHLSRQAISKYELNQSEPDIDTIKQLATLFQVSTDVLLSQEPIGSDEETSHEEKEAVPQKEGSVESFLRKVLVKKTQYSYLVIFVGSVHFLFFLGINLFKVNYVSTNNVVRYYGSGNFYDWLTHNNVWLTDTRFVFGYIFYLFVFLASVFGLVLPWLFIYFESKGKNFYKPVLIATIIEMGLCLLSLILFNFFNGSSLYSGGAGGYFLFILALAQSLVFFFVHRHLEKKDQKKETEAS